MAKEHHKTNVRLGYSSSVDRLRITIPDTVDFPHNEVWCWIEGDGEAIILSPKKPTREAEKRSIKARDGLPGCRELTLDKRKGLGRYFTQMNVHFTMNRVNGRMKVFLPPDEKRMQPRTKPSKVPTPEFKLNQEDPLVLVAVGGKDYEFHVPLGELIDTITDWKARGYGG